eukprot:4006434-Pleurochrysis_carterae.AAC.1
MKDNICTLLQSFSLSYFACARSTRLDLRNIDGARRSVIELSLKARCRLLSLAAHGVVTQYSLGDFINNPNKIQFNLYVMRSQAFRRPRDRLH